MKKLIDHISHLKFKPVTVTLMLGLLLFFGNSLRPTAALVTTDEPTSTAGGNKYPAYQEQAVEGNNNQCDVYMKDFAAKETQDFNKFINTNFQNKSSSASLLQGAIAKYRQMRDELYTAYGRYYPSLGSVLINTSIQPGSCMTIINATLSDAKKQLKVHAQTTSSVKKSSALLEKYQQINSELANLYQQFVYLRSYMDSFSQKLACYPKTGCIKG